MSTTLASANPLTYRGWGIRFYFSLGSVGVVEIPAIVVKIYDAIGIVALLHDFYEMWSESNE